MKEYESEFKFILGASEIRSGSEKFDFSYFRKIKKRHANDKNLNKVIYRTISYG
jgi:hypothetical protein